MAKKKSVLEMMDRFMEFHQKGYTIPDIARYFGITSRTVYLHLEQIATVAGTTRRALLMKPHKPHSSHKHTYTTSETGFEELESMLKEAMVQVNTLLGIIAELEETTS